MEPISPVTCVVLLSVEVSPRTWETTRTTVEGRLESCSVPARVSSDPLGDLRPVLGDRNKTSPLRKRGTTRQFPPPPPKGHPTPSTRTDGAPLPTCQCGFRVVGGRDKSPTGQTICRSDVPSLPPSPKTLEGGGVVERAREGQGDGHGDEAGTETSGPWDATPVRPGSFDPAHEGRLVVVVRPCPRTCCTR